ncbi:MAG TPA: hypothetical protein VN131_05550, partial [Mobilitalea sp.]|nr:hypothetical protein [Mobilitalea sp.]
MGILISGHPELEQDLIEAFENPEENSLDQDIKAGRALEDKYGYLDQYGTADKSMIKSVNLTLLI